MTLEEDRAEVNRVAASWQDAPEAVQESMLGRLGKMLEYLDLDDDAEHQLKRDAERLMKNIEAGLGRR